MASKSKRKNDGILSKVFRERIAEFSDPKKSTELWKRTRGALADALAGGEKLFDGVLVSFRDNGLSAANNSYRYVQDAQSKYARLRRALLRQEISAARFADSYRQIREMTKTNFKSINEREIRKVAIDVEKAVNSGIEMIMKLPGKIFG